MSTPVRPVVEQRGGDDQHRHVDDRRPAPWRDDVDALEAQQLAPLGGVAARDARGGQRRVQVDDVRHHGRAEDADGEQQAVGAAEVRHEPGSELAAVDVDVQRRRRGSRARRSRASRRSPARSGGSRASAARGSRRRRPRSSGPPTNGGTPNSRLSAIAAPTNSARSVAMAIASACTHRPKVTGRGKCSRHSSGRLRPVAMPVLADRYCIEHRHQVRGDDHPQQQVAVLGAAGDVRGEVARIDVGDGGDERRPEQRRARRAPGPRRRSAAQRRARAASRRRGRGAAIAPASAVGRRSRAPTLDPHRARPARRRARARRSPKRTNSGPPNGWRSTTCSRSPGAMPRSAR